MSTSFRSSTDWSVLPLAERYDSLCADTLDWQTISFVGKLKMTSPENHSCSARFFMVKDSLIHISIRAYGVEGAVIRLTRDSVSIYNKVDKVIVETSMSRFFGNTGITIYDIQNIAMGRIPINHFSVSESVMTAKRGGLWSLVQDVDHNYSGIHSEFTISSSSNMPVGAVFLTQTASTDIQYNKWSDFGSMLMPAGYDLTFTHRGLAKKIAFNLKVAPKGLKINQGQIPAWKVGRGIVRTDYDQIYHQLITTLQ
ncbi:MAG: DUF4292 domain-containing protein [Muribaculaceae bacterium]|nr:DUF4292 domain-containing protein [Muribaculaceae bacterium]